MNNLSVFLVIVLLSSCSGADEFDDEPLFKTNFDDIAGWVSEQNLVYSMAYSGKYSLGVNPVNEYSIIWKRSWKKLSDKNFSIVRISTFAKKIGPDNNACIVVSIDRGKQNLYWESMEFKDFSLSSKKFKKIESYIGFPIIKEPDAIISIYLWSKGNSTVVIDDLELEFSY